MTVHKARSGSLGSRHSSREDIRRALAEDTRPWPEQVESYLAWQRRHYLADLTKKQAAASISLLRAELLRLGGAEAVFDAVERHVKRSMLELRREMRYTTPALRELSSAKDGAGLVSPPAFHIGSFLRLLLGERAFEQVFGQTMADAQLEWMDAHAGGDLDEARRVKVRAVFCLVWTAVAYPLARVAALVSNLRKIAPPGE